MGTIPSVMGDSSRIAWGRSLSARTWPGIEKAPVVNAESPMNFLLLIDMIKYNESRVGKGGTMKPGYCYI
jgi:hypothetical protein